MNVPELLSCARSLEEFAPDYAQVLDELASLFVRIAMKQAVSDFEGDELYAPEVLERLAKAIAPEDVQLFYQTAITGRRDLGLAPDPRTGFEMTLLRMIAFRPVGEAEQPRAPAPAAGATAGGGGAAAARAAAGGSGARGGAGGSRRAVARMKAPRRVATPVSGAAAARAAASGWYITVRGDAPAAERRAYRSNHGPPSSPAWNWWCRAAIGQQLSLDRTPRRRRASGTGCPQQAHADPGTGRETHAGAVPIFWPASRLEFEVAATGVETPAQAEQRASIEDLDAARRAFESDPGVQGLRERFGATLLPDTVRPVK